MKISVVDRYLGIIDVYIDAWYISKNISMVDRYLSIIVVHVDG